MVRRAYPSDVDDEPYHVLLPYPALGPEAAPQRKNPSREVLNAPLWTSRTGAEGEDLPNDVPHPGSYEPRPSAGTTGRSRRKSSGAMWVLGRRSAVR